MARSTMIQRLVAEDAEQCAKNDHEKGIKRTNKGIDFLRVNRLKGPLRGIANAYIFNQTYKATMKELNNPKDPQ